MLTPFFLESSSIRLTMSFPKASNSLELSMPWTNASEERFVSLACTPLARIPPASAHQGIHLHCQILGVGEKSTRHLDPCMQESFLALPHGRLRSIDFA